MHARHYKVNSRHFPRAFIAACLCLSTRNTWFSLRGEELALTRLYSINSGVVLEKVCEYLYYNLKHKDEKNVPDMEIPAELCLELLMAADYLNV